MTGSEAPEGTPLLRERDGSFSWFTTPAEGMAVIFVHGWCCAPQFFAEAVRNLPEGFKGYALDLFDRQTARDKDFSVSGLAGAIAGFARDRGKAIVVGHSFGGVVAQKIGIDHGDAVQRIVLCGTGASLRGYNLRMSEILERLRRQGNSRPFVRELMAKFFHLLPPEPVFESFVDHVCGVDAEAMERALISLMETDLEDDVRRISMPVLHIHGDRDRGRTMEHVRFLEENVPDIRVEIFEDTGHAMMVERPCRYCALLNAFLTGALPGSGQ